MNNAKYWLDSSTIQATLRALVPTAILIARAFGLELGEGELIKAVEAVGSLVASIWVLVEFVNVIRGRFKAEQPLSGHK